MLSTHSLLVRRELGFRASRIWAGCCRGSQPASYGRKDSRMDLEEEPETSAALSLALSSRSGSTPDFRAHLATPPSPMESQNTLADSEDPVEGAIAPKINSSSQAYKELLEVITRAVEKFNIDWPREEEVACSRLDECFLSSENKYKAPSHCRKLPLFPEVHDEISCFYRTPYTSRVYNPAASDYSAVFGSEQYGYLAMPKVEEVLASHLFPSTAGNLGRPTLPSKPCKATSALVGKAYMAVGLACGSLPTINLSGMGDKDKVSLLNTPVKPSGLFGGAVNAIADMFSEAKQQTATFSQFLPHRVEFARASMSGARASANARETQKTNVAGASPRRKPVGPGAHSHSLQRGLI
ncbi:uncharacterized protein LOC108267367 [Ictalurus punctatus]|uniref:Uncharacterized protein LOC108267367 n=1 Tax=Ictalurus punctatus TaxID=7998 RepID=A0A9F7RIC4_ICTPU|nr:uncharacterized protein LOC108267367 [Ictalurus punctatus]XP_053537261.1 uncharacterized protein LOC108267367 [Ictalurus punctatus]XP_053537262.1 uncharacterized protein LOC108267367 [Ictalurus punctatus]XP_053537263.1 uncharacterized protein LOC108267367 [Ictalurus punctatus]XP_053537264.1 uncharacterized protein LOC108267367 [Ictalurus punctatus]XP_053537265.1 uncharacterized protein LOC108267367 [Ictalurus punctatus]XP_053537266.1 uncharacterized protein LOC108267367 [Ictalurus punctatu